MVKDYGTYEIIGRTRDDAAGEAFDKVARAVGLGYPGGPKVDKLAKEGNPHAIEFPRAHVDDAPYDFSFSGIKSAVLNYINSCEMKQIEINKADLVASFQNAVVEALVSRAIRLTEEMHIKSLPLRAVWHPILHCVRHSQGNVTATVFSFIHRRRFSAQTMRQ